MKVIFRNSNLVFENLKEVNIQSWTDTFSAPTSDAFRGVLNGKKGYVRLRGSDYASATLLINSQTTGKVLGLYDIFHKFEAPDDANISFYFSTGVGSVTLDYVEADVLPKNILTKFDNSKNFRIDTNYGIISPSEAGTIGTFSNPIPTNKYGEIDVNQSISALFVLKYGDDGVEFKGFEKLTTIPTKIDLRLYDCSFVRFGTYEKVDKIVTF